MHAYIQGSGSPALCAPVAIAEVSETQNQTSCKALRPTCGHYLLATEACVLGALTATTGMMSKMLKGQDGAIEGWKGEFQKSSTEMASACTPMGAWVLENHVFKNQKA
jgi:hypothetical protein